MSKLLNYYQELAMKEFGEFLEYNDLLMKAELLDDFLESLEREEEQIHEESN